MTVYLFKCFTVASFPIYRIRYHSNLSSKYKNLDFLKVFSRLGSQICYIKTLKFCLLQEPKYNIKMLGQSGHGGEDVKFLILLRK